MPDDLLLGCRVLVVEDEYFIARHLCDGLRDHGAEIAGPVPTVDRAMHLLSLGGIDAAVLDINLGGQSVLALAGMLSCPFVFVTGYNQRTVPARFAHVPLLEKPAEAAAVARMLAAMLLAPA